MLYYLHSVDSTKPNIPALQEVIDNVFDDPTKYAMGPWIMFFFIRRHIRKMDGLTAREREELFQYLHGKFYVHSGVGAESEVADIKRDGASGMASLDTSPELEDAECEKYLTFLDVALPENLSMSDTIRQLNDKASQWIDNECEAKWKISPSKASTHLEAGFGFGNDGTNGYYTNSDNTKPGFGKVMINIAGEEPISTVAHEREHARVEENKLSQADINKFTSRVTTPLVAKISELLQRLGGLKASQMLGWMSSFQDENLKNMGYPDDHITEEKLVRTPQAIIKLGRVFPEARKRIVKMFANLSENMASFMKSKKISTNKVNALVGELDEIGDFIQEQRQKKHDLKEKIMDLNLKSAYKKQKEIYKHEREKDYMPYGKKLAMCEKLITEKEARRAEKYKQKQAEIDRKHARKLEKERKRENSNSAIGSAY